MKGAWIQPPGSSPPHSTPFETADDNTKNCLESESSDNLSKKNISSGIGKKVLKDPWGK